MVTTVAMTTGMETMAKEHIKSQFIFFICFTTYGVFLDYQKDFWLSGKKNFKEEAVIGAIFSFFVIISTHACI